MEIEAVFNAQMTPENHCTIGERELQLLLLIT